MKNWICCLLAVGVLVCTLQVSAQVRPTATKTQNYGRSGGEEGKDP